MRRVRSILAMCTTLLFASVLLVPCLCAATMAESGDLDGSDCCPSQNDDGDPPSQDNSSHDCCGSCGTSCTKSDAPTVSSTGDIIVSSTEEFDAADESLSWWTPELVAGLWFVEQLAVFDVGPTATTSRPDRPAPLPDRSKTYLHHATFLL